jgi:ABC-type polar amino acid transport system ATPase subunit
VKLTRLELERFTVFEKAVFDFAPGVNVIIGENGTGKSHLLKVIYCLNESVRQFTTDEGRDLSVRAPKLVEIFFKILSEVFQPERLENLIRRGGEAHAKIRATWESGEIAITVAIELTPNVSLASNPPMVPTLERSIFIPAYEVLSIFPGFISAYVRRESAFDRTIYDLCLALDARPLRQPPDDLRAHFLEPIEDVLGGKVVNENGRFYLKLPDGNMEATLVAEGLRKLAMIDYLLTNGSLTPNGFLLWDEPEASLNPRLTRLTGHLALGLARSGVQTWLSTHDYLLTSETSLAAEQSSRNDVAFFALARSSNASEGTLVECGDRLADLQHNSILRALADLHEREQAAALG